jgi:hypothetical protein
VAQRMSAVRSVCMSVYNLSIGAIEMFARATAHTRFKVPKMVEVSECATGARIEVSGCATGA